MTEFIEFCREYGVYILTFLCFVIEVIFIFIKRTPKTVDDFVLALNEVKTLLPVYIISQEEPGNGDKKKYVVLDMAIRTFSKKLGRGLTDKEFDIVRQIFAEDIEIILSTPQKKEKL